MKKRLLQLRDYTFKNNDKAAVVFLLKLLLLLLLLKSFFFLHNLPAEGISELNTLKGKIIFTKWLLWDELLVLLLINTPYIFILTVCSFFKNNSMVVFVITLLFLLLNFICILLNLFDVFYFHFHQQRADADLLYVLQHLPDKTIVRNPVETSFALFGAAVLFYILFRIHKKLLHRFHSSKKFILTALMMIFFLFLLLYPSKKFIPTYPLTELSSVALPFVQNSFHTFLYAVYRKEAALVRPLTYMPTGDAEKLEGYISNDQVVPEMKTGRNIVLFIMESVPADFFIDSGKYKVVMPFLDSLLQRSSYFQNAFSFGRSSNKGITSVLTGMPTLTEIPLYHSGYAGIPMTRIGSELQNLGYRSAFFIGDDFDDFGFAKCVNWLGIQKYYCKNDIPENQNLPMHTMGLHDDAVLKFMHGKLNTMQQPFFAVHYNISTHFPNDLPAEYTDTYPVKNFSREMKSMHYYNESLERFFKQAATSGWYNNTVFIFCSDHWMDPDANERTNNLVGSFHIPIIIYDPAVEKSRRINTPVSQLDVVNTILSIAGSKKPFISYGKNLLAEMPDPGRIVYSKQNAELYQAYDNSHVLGYNVVSGKVDYSYRYKFQSGLPVLQPVDSTDVAIARLSLHMKAFLQTASLLYNTGREK